MLSTENKVHNLEAEKVIKNLLKQRTEGMFCDVKLCLQGSVVWGHSCVLAPFSSHIMEHFRADSQRTNHWCPQKPLVIDLDLVITVSQDKCILCLSTLVDFLYSQDLVIMDGHYQHFSKMIYYLKILDLFPMFNKNVNVENFTSVIKEPNPQTFYDDFISENNVVIETSQNYKSEKLLTPAMPEINHQTQSLTTNICEITNSYKKQPDEETQLNTSPELNQSCGNTESLLYGSRSVDVIVEEHNYGTTLKQKCEFLCCSGEVSSNRSINHRRTIRCDVCTFTAVSVKKMLKHIESDNHLGKKCSICTQNFHSADSLLQHLKDHKNPKPYLCQICSKRSKFWEFYQTHLKVHCRNKQVYCKICPRSFTSQQNLKVHLKSHKANYLCSSCKFLASDADDFKAHLLIHEEKSSSVNLDTGIQNSYDNFMSISDNDLIKHKTAAQFLCNKCGKGFTQKNNLKRHIELKHLNVTNFHCCKCTFVTKRKDSLKTHMKRHHNCCLPNDVLGASKRVAKSVSKKKKMDKGQSEVVGVLIPVQLVSTTDSSTLDAFAVKTCVTRELESVEGNPEKKLKSDESLTTNTNNSKNVMETHHLSGNSVENKFDFADNCDTIINGSVERLQPMPCLVDYRAVEDKSDSLLKNNELHIENDCIEKEQNVGSNLTNLQLNLNADNLPCSTSIDLTQPVLNISHEFNDLQIALEEGNTNLNSIQVEPDLLSKTGGFWLNEATGEFLNENSLVSVQMIDTSCRFNSVSSPAKNSHKETIDPLHTLILGDASKAVSIFDLRDDVDEFTSNPQTPQTNLVEVEDPDNLFPWSCIDNSFCSTWVLNEATGELNMVSFNVQPIKHSDESKLDENTGMFSPKDDDETALFLNEGTGDLSVIYFNPSNRECDNSKQLYNEQGTQDIPDNVSEHSNDEEDFLNAEFFKATASFMAHKENETFLNELTGEFDTNIADFDNYHRDLLENQISGSESYLNEETGEILWNVLNKNVGSDFFTNSDNFKYDLDDSLNCDDLEPFANGMNDFSSQFGLENTQDWPSVDETCDILLNECTGELVKKS